MANETKQESPRPFDAKVVEHLVGLMDKFELSEISLKEGDRKIKIRKGGPIAATVAAAPQVQAAAPQAAALVQSSASNAVAPAAEAAKTAKKYLEIKSPMVGTYYAKPAPDKPDYVKIGSQVKPDTIVCKLEAMKIFNDLTADITGTIAEVCVKNGDSVEYGTVLFRVDA